jgi:CelD/BcsL family acetyltransferase involved in cellulose biosynthesis
VHDTCLFFALPATEADLRGLISRKLFKDVRASWRQIESLGPVRVEVAKPENLKELLTSLIDLHNARWTARGEPGVLSPVAVQEAHRETVPGLFKLSLLRFYGLRVAGRIVGALYGFVHQRRFHCYLMGFDPELARFSLGSLMFDHAIRAAIHEGVKEFDFLRGTEAYKYRWGPRETFTYRRRLWHA